MYIKLPCPLIISGLIDHAASGCTTPALSYALRFLHMWLGIAFLSARFAAECLKINEQYILHLTTLSIKVAWSSGMTFASQVDRERSGFRSSQ